MNNDGIKMSIMEITELKREIQQIAARLGKTQDYL